MDMPIRIRNLCNRQHTHFYNFSTRASAKLTAAGLIFASGTSFSNALAHGTSITPSMTAYTTCTPFGPNSFASDWLSPRFAKLPAANDAEFGNALTPAEAPVKISVGGRGRLVLASSSGRTACENKNAP